MLTKMDSQRDVSVTTYRDGVPEGRAARAFYKRIGFTEGKHNIFYLPKLIRNGFTWQRNMTDF